MLQLTLPTRTAWMALFAFVTLQNCAQRSGGDRAIEESGEEYYTAEEFASVPKFDSHIHLNTDDPAFIEQSVADNFRFLDIVDDRPFGISLEDQQKIARKQVKAFPDRILYATTFPVGNWNSDEWEAETIAYLRESFSQGATAVKVWKNVGMDLKDRDGKFVMIDHPRFDTILTFLAENGIPLVAHLGEPKDCWLSLEEMTIRGNQNYYRAHPEYHMYLHPDYPSYEDQIAARDHMLEKHPDLLFIGAHLGSLEWNLDELAKRLDRFPNMAVDLARMANLQYHAMTDWKRTRDFFIRYQDRLLYATDRAVNPTDDAAEFQKQVHEARIRDWRFFTTDETMNSQGFDGSFKGLNLPRAVVDKIYRENAAKWLEPKKHRTLTGQK